MIILNGKFRYRNSIFLGVGIAAFFVLMPIMSKLTSEPWIPMSLLSAVCLVLIIMAVSMPCRYFADDEGITFMKGFLRRRIAYSDIRQVSFYTKQGFPINKGATEFMLKHVIEIKTSHGEYCYSQECGKLDRMGNYIFKSNGLRPENCELKKIADHLKGWI